MRVVALIEHTLGVATVSSVGIGCEPFKWRLQYAHLSLKVCIQVIWQFRPHLRLRDVGGILGRDASLHLLPPGDFAAPCGIIIARPRLQFFGVDRKAIQGR